MTLPKTDKNLLLLLILNATMFVLHINKNCEDVYYFFQLTIVGQIFVLLNFLLSIILHEKKSSQEIKHLLSRFHLMGISLEAIVVLGFWGLRVFFRKGIIKEGE